MDLSIQATSVTRLLDTILFDDLNCFLSGADTFLNTPCPPGRYCPAGTTHGDQHLCPAGSYFNETGAKDLYDCLPCPPGEYCEVDGLTYPTGKCDPGMCFFLFEYPPVCVCTQICSSVSFV